MNRLWLREPHISPASVDRYYFLSMQAVFVAEKPVNRKLNIWASGLGSRKA